VRLVGARHNYPVHVVRHQAIAEHARAKARRGRANQPEVDLPVGVGEEDRLAVQSSLRQMMRYANQHRSRHSRHHQMSSGAARELSRKHAGCPRFSPGFPRISPLSALVRLFLCPFELVHVARNTAGSAEPALRMPIRH